MGDITNRHLVFSIATGQDVVIHLAGLVSHARSDSNRLRSVNGQGVLNIVDACLEHEVSRLIHVSSVGALGMNRSGTPTDETAEFNWPRSFHYMVSKRLGQSIVERAVRDRGLNAVVVCPSTILGPGDPDHDSNQNRLFRSLRNARVYPTFRGGLSVVDVRDVVDLIARALDQSIPEGCYIAAGANMDYRDVIRLIALGHGHGVIPVPVPAWFLTLSGFAAEILGQLRGAIHRPLLTANYGRLSAWRCFYDSSLSRRVFGQEYRPCEVTIADTCESVANRRARE